MCLRHCTFAMPAAFAHVHAALQAFAENILLCGGGSCIPGIEAKFAAELQALSPPSLPPAMCSCPDYMPDHTFKYSSWMGAAILSKVSARQSGSTPDLHCWHAFA